MHAGAVRADVLAWDAAAVLTLALILWSGRHGRDQGELTVWRVQQGCQGLIIWTKTAYQGIVNALVPLNAQRGSYISNSSKYRCQGVINA